MARSSAVSFPAGRAESREASMIDIDFLGALHLKNFGDRAAAARGGFPVNLIEAVAGDVFAKFFELAAAADLAHGVESLDAPPQSLQIVIAAQIRIDANFERERRRARRTAQRPSGDAASR